MSRELARQCSKVWGGWPEDFYGVVAFMSAPDTMAPDLWHLDHLPLADRAAVALGAHVSVTGRRPVRTRKVVEYLTTGH